jgi:NADH dehydrogenase (ubiquinone) Fe-S protein 1
LGDNAKTIDDIVSGNHPFAEKLQKAKRPIIIVGANLLARNDGQQILDTLQAFAGTLKPEDVSEFSNCFYNLKKSGYCIIM